MLDEHCRSVEVNASDALLRVSVRFAFALVCLCVAAARVADAAQGDAVGSGLTPYVATNAKIVAIEHVRVVDGMGTAPQANRTVVFTGGVIAALGPTGGIAIPEGATRVDGTGKRSCQDTWECITTCSSARKRLAPCGDPCRTAFRASTSRPAPRRSAPPARWTSSAT